MSDTIWIDVKDRAESDVPRDNSMMFKLEKNLDRLADQLHVTRLSRFYDHSAQAEEFAEFLPEDGKVEENWCDPADALITVRTLYAHLKSHPADLNFKSDRSRTHWPDALLEELSEAELVLARAVTQKKKIRLLIVP